MEKVQQPDDVVVQSLINLRDELWARQDPQLSEVFFKINSCLYRTYPENLQKETK